jgi:hypothetical protein
MRFKVVFLLCFFAFKAGFGQPIFDVMSLQYQEIPSSQLLSNQNDGKSTLQYFQSQLNLPWKWNKNNTAVFNPQYETRNVEFHPDSVKSSTTLLHLQTFSLTISNQFVFQDTSRQLLFAAGIRHYATTRLSMGNNTITPSFAVLYAKRKSSTFAWKAGVYYSKEMFGNFWLPLLGFDWKASDRFWCWGILPRFAVFDYTVTPHWHSGIVYKGVNDSYRLPDEDWFLIGEGQLRWANDFYIPKTPMMLTIDIGHTLARQFRFYDDERFSKQKLTPTNGLILKIGLTYRVVTDKRFRTSKN